MYYLSFIDTVVTKIEEFLQVPIDFFTTHYRNPFLWLLFFFLGLVIFNATYRALQKEK